MNFDVRDNAKLGTLNDIYKVSTRGRILPSRKFDEEHSSVKYAAERQMLSLLPHYLGYGLVICNPSVWYKHCAQIHQSLYRKALEAYGLLKSDLRSKLEYEDKSSTFKKKAFDQKLKRLVELPPSSLLDESSKLDEFIVVPTYMAFTLFGPGCIDSHLPTWLDARILDEMSMDVLFLRLCSHNTPPVAANLKNAFQKVLQGKIPLTQELQLNLTLRAEPLNQLAVVSFCVYQLRQSMKGFLSGNVTHQKGGIIDMPCGSGKTKTSLTIWRDLLHEDYDSVSNNDYGVIQHVEDVPLSSEKPSQPSISNFFVSRNQAATPGANAASSAPKTIGGVDALPETHPFKQWLKLQPNVYSRSQSKPVRTGKLLWVVDHDDLLEQAATAIVDCMPGVRLAILKQKSRPNPDQCDVVVASIRTIVSQTFNQCYFEKFTLVIYDEAHRNLASFFRQVLQKLFAIPLALWLTATPRNDMLRQIGGPVLVSCTRPYIKQQHIVVLTHGIDPKLRPVRYMRSYRGKSGANEANIDNNTMHMDIVVNHPRNAMLVDTTYSICVGNMQCDDVKSFRITRRPSPNIVRQSWKTLFHNIHCNDRSFLGHSRLLSSDDFAWTKAAGITSDFDVTKSQRVPIIYSTSVPHIILLQHMFAQKWLDEARKKPEYVGQELAIIRTGLRQIAVVNLTRMSDASKNSIRWIGDGGDGPQMSCSASKTRNASPEFYAHMKSNKGFSAAFWEIWFKTYPICKKIAVDTGKVFPFQDDSSKRRNTKKQEVGTSLDGIEEDDTLEFNFEGDFDEQESDLTAASKSLPKKKKTTTATKCKSVSSDVDELKNTTSTAWTYKSQYYWTPVYYPLPSAVSVQNPNSASKPRPTKKRKRGVMEDDGMDQQEDEESSSNCKLFAKQTLLDTRPPLEKSSDGQVLATFGLYIGIGSYPSPSSVLSNIPLATKSAHNYEALHSDYVFANYSVASTGIDREAIDTTVMAMPYKDPEQMHGRAARILKTKQISLHLEFGEPTSIYPGQTMLHVEGMAQQKVESEFYIVER